MFRIITISSLAIMLAGASLTGCASAERSREEARASASSFQSSLQKLPPSIDSTLKALAETISTGNTNRAESFREFSQQLNYMNSFAERLGKHADAAQANAQEFFRQYTEEAMSSRDPAARSAAMANLTSRQDAVETAAWYLNQGRNKYREFAGTLRDIQNQLRGDLSPAAVERMTMKVQAVIAEGNDVRNYVDRLDEQIDSILSINR
jgi:uncharacterized protein (DUF3084 family)